MDADNGNMKTVPHCHTDDAHRKLEVMLALDDNNAAQMVRMRKSASYSGDKIRAGFIKGHDVIYALHSTVMQSLNCMLPEITISEDKCTHIMVPMIKKS